VAVPELVASCCTLLVLAPLALMPGMGTFLFRPMAFAVAFAMIAAYLLSRTLVPALGNLWLRAHGPQPHPHLGNDYEHRSDHENPQAKGILGRAFAAWESLINLAIQGYVSLLRIAMRYRLLVVGAAVVLLAVVVLGLGSRLRREFFPEVDAGAFEMYVRARSGTRIEETEKRIAAVEKVVHEKVGDDVELVISEIGKLRPHGRGGQGADEGRPSALRPASGTNAP
jgi:multidrug efflux pump subunit AcrB